MRRVWPVLGAGLLVACTNGLETRQAELTQWVGQPETQLLAAMGAPNRVYESGATKFLTFEDRRVEQQPAWPSYYGPGYGPVFGPGPLGYGGTIFTTVCDTTFTVSGGVVRAFSLRGNGCG